MRAAEVAAERERMQAKAREAELLEQARSEAERRREIAAGQWNVARSQLSEEWRILDNEAAVVPVEDDRGDEGREANRVDEEGGDGVGRQPD